MFQFHFFHLILIFFQFQFFYIFFNWFLNYEFTPTWSVLISRIRILSKNVSGTTWSSVHTQIWLPFTVRANGLSTNEGAKSGSVTQRRRRNHRPTATRWILAPPLDLVSWAFFSCCSLALEFISSSSTGVGGFPTSCTNKPTSDPSNGGSTLHVPGS